MFPYASFVESGQERNSSKYRPCPPDVLSMNVCSRRTAVWNAGAWDFFSADMWKGQDVQGVIYSLFRTSRKTLGRSLYIENNRYRSGKIKKLGSLLEG
ncbi:hypothetical protein GE21DRAFT_28 [Neurospora crassa]|uniref:Uncharacterized protein n=1 Tax=Neurospora crassa (strain ATCC 24698 / 74-OR23-1A / CBS 708.71 / DSM 1257 / FGSC 987) TaxID=367110 RepID=Q7SGM4_NEUCR|nr:hypothetical protein NCU08059 [Neurospora crassa OR74A]EAA35954.1 hypothetical protein NCU08059 [Neurospora crassa OR74A]KHE80637.1 hypothetical protein GE21DRAFT_28 [Neurospora crassa]|eukprot:XP_965190.1 hypothetical protein NCU08059 [Neurospora crassa OR74A]